ncbi:hypothetical protein [Catellatospora methionotrophica]|uniref:hypothetical protein n=1 Tax=Catellatospora methionotrophica TaxID=121620 RepID=UPI0033E44993
MLRKRLLTFAAAVLMVFTAQAMTANAAHASASGCTFAPGYSGAQNCIDVNGSGLNVSSSRSIYKPGVTTWPPQICNRQHQWRYTRNGGSQTTRSETAPSCIPGILNDFVDWSNPGTMANNSTFCARTNNSHTSGVWTNYACVKIES